MLILTIFTLKFLVFFGSIYFGWCVCVGLLGKKSEESNLSVLFSSDVFLSQKQKVFLKKVREKFKSRKI
jgi:hypothetical protein